MENKFTEAQESIEKRGQLTDEGLELFTVVLDEKGKNIDIAFPEHIFYLLSNDKTGKLEDKLRKALIQLKPAIDGVTIAIKEAIEEQGLI